MLFNKKGQGLPLNTIIIAIIVIVVLVLIILIFTGQMTTFANVTNSDRGCRAEGGTCMAETTCTLTGGQEVGSAADNNCPGTVNVCCTPPR